MPSTPLQIALYLLAGALGAVLTWWTQRRQAEPAEQRAARENLDELRQKAVEVQSSTIDGLNKRIQLLETRAVETEQRHQAEMTELRGQLAAQLARKDMIITKMQEDQAAKDAELQEHVARMAALEKKQAEMAAALAEYALRDSHKRTRSADLHAVPEGGGQ